MPEDSAIAREIESWQGFSAVLRLNHREKFEKMMSEAKAYGAAFNNAQTKEPAEALIMTLIFQQQQVITKLLDVIAKLEKRKIENTKL